MKRRVLLRLPFAVAVLAAPALHAQDAPRLAEGTRVRVTAPALAIDRQAGRVASLSVDTLFLARGPERTLTAVPRGAITRLEVSRGRGERGKSALRMAGIGFLAGAAAGALFGLSCTDPECNEGLPAIGAAVGAGFGAIAGGVIGAARGREAWEPVPLGAAAAAPPGGRGRGLALGLTLRP
ncbi:MAG TPA: hypothetical protein VF746_20330 [Longimicrobium sp.]|jgi:hypothetical protein